MVAIATLLQVETVDNPPNSRSTMYYQLSAFVDEVRACEALPVDQRAKPWTYALKPSPVRIMKLQQVATAADELLVHCCCTDCE